MEEKKTRAALLGRFNSPLVRTTLFIPAALRRRLKERAHELTDPGEEPVSMAEVMRTMLIDAFIDEEVNSDK